MSGLTDLLSSQIGQSLIKGVAGKMGMGEGTASSVISMALPVLMGAMNKNASTPEGAEGLLGALKSKHDGSVLEDIGGFLEGGDFSDGEGILRHVLGGRQQQVAGSVAKASGVDSNAVSQIFQMAAPILMGVLGKEQRTQGLNTEGLSGLLGNMASQSAGNQNQQSMIEKMLDADGDGSIVDDVVGMLGSFLRK